jgi:hypothetical protein
MSLDLDTRTRSVPNGRRCSAVAFTRNEHDAARRSPEGGVPTRELVAAHCDGERGNFSQKTWDVKAGDELLLERVEGGRAERRFILEEPQLVVRDTTGPPPNKGTRT